MNFNRFEKVIKEFSEKYDDKNMEFEIRFGKFIYNKDDKKTFFDSSVDIDFFYKLKNHLIQKKFKYKVINTIETSIADNVKKIENTDTNDISFLSKSRISNYDVYDYDLRFSLSSEIAIQNNASYNIVKENAQYYTRNKKRYRFFVDIGFIDLTIVDTNNKKKTFEIELEINKLEHHKIEQLILFIMQIKQNNIYIISTSDKRKIFNEYKNLTKSTFFIGAQPETLQKDKLQTLYQELYSVTDKADGERTFMYIDNNGAIFYIDSNINNIYITDLVSKEYKNCLIDGEFVKLENGVSILYAFDILFYNGTDIRGNKEFLLQRRLDIVKSIIDSIPPTSYYKLHIKKFIYRNVFLGSKIIMKNINNMPYKDDGLIFTPMNEPYPQTKSWNKLLKWKPEDMNSIDFFSIKNKETGEWDLYVQNSVIKSDNKNQSMSNLILFDIHKLCENEELEYITFKTKFDEDTLLDPTTNEKYQSETVIEFYWDKNTKLFVPIRTRWDKTTNPKKHGNFKTVACNIWKNIMNPVTETVLYNMNNNMTKLLNFNEKVDNNYYFTDVISNIDNTLSKIIKKYDCENKYINYFAVNQNINSKKLIKCSKMDPYFESKETFDNFLDKCSTIGEYLLLSYIDAEVYETINKNDLIKITANEILYVVLMEDRIYQIDNIRSKISMYIKNYKHECDMTSYIINKKYFEEYMKNKGFDLVETDMIKPIADNHLSKIYRYSLFQVNKDKISNKLIDNVTDYVKEISFDKKNNNNKSVFRLDNLYFFIEILNSTGKYRFKKTKYPNYFIKSFEELVQINNKEKILPQDINLKLITNLEKESDYDEENTLYFYENIIESDGENNNETCDTFLYIVMFNNKLNI